MSQPVIRFENVGKLYRLGTVGTGTIAHDLQRWWITSILRKEDPYLTIGETNDRSTKGHSDYVYALKEINLEVQEGDVLGIIGKNGAGKSTLLKLLSRVTAPTTGKIYTKGRIASLLEVGTGFHPELTGRENIYMNGSILGMKKHEIDRKLDEIIDFSGCERYIDTPVKRYSSGMMVRLGFAVAAHLDPEILVVDEVLAVGDAEFQKKAIGKMQDVSKGQGRTVLFVSHNMTAVKNLCKTGILLNNGIIESFSSINDIVNLYLEDNIIHKKIIDNISKIDRNISINNITINNITESTINIKNHLDKLHIEIHGVSKKRLFPEVCIVFKNNDGVALADYNFNEHKETEIYGNFSLTADIKLPPKIHSGILYLDLYIHKPNVEFYLEAPNCCKINVIGYVPPSGQTPTFRSGFCSL